MSATPRLDAVEAWIAAGGVGELVVPSDPPGWPALMSESDRHWLAVRCCASGARASLPRRHIIEVATGRELPPPPPTKRRRPSRRKPR